MALRRQLLFVLVAIFPTMGASYSTTNFTVYAADAQVAQRVGQAAEHYRKEKALQWLGYEMPTWGQRCPVYVKVTMSGPGGATSFVFDKGQILSQKMEIFGPLDRLLASVLPHEVTHTVFAYYFRQPVPRWADEGGSVLSEDDAERDRHDRLVRQFLNEGRAFSLRSLFTLKDYPRDMSQVGCMYAEGFSMANYLVANSDRKTYLKFVAQGMRQGWDNAVRTYYRHNSVEGLEQAWLAELRRTKRRPGMGTGTVLVNNNTTGPANGYAASRTLVRLTAPPVQPLEESPPGPVYRGKSGSSEQGEGRFGDNARPRYLPDYNPASTTSLPSRQRAVAPDGWQPAARPQPYVPVQVELGPPQFPQPPAPRLEQPVPSSASPVGYPD